MTLTCKATALKLYSSNSSSHQYVSGASVMGPSAWHWAMARHEIGSSYGLRRNLSQRWEHAGLLLQANTIPKRCLEYMLHRIRGILRLESLKGMTHVGRSCIVRQDMEMQFFLTQKSDF